jgi:hypothetical protein
MTYPYGTKGAPVVGNGLGGLPRRASPPPPPVVTQEVWVATGAAVAISSAYTTLTIGSSSAQICVLPDDGSIFMTTSNGTNFSHRALRCTEAGLVNKYGELNSAEDFAWAYVGANQYPVVAVGPCVYTRNFGGSIGMLNTNDGSMVGSVNWSQNGTGYAFNNFRSMAYDPVAGVGIGVAFDSNSSVSRVVTFDPVTRTTLSVTAQSTVSNSYLNGAGIVFGGKYYCVHQSGDSNSAIGGVLSINTDLTSQTNNSLVGYTSGGTTSTDSNQQPFRLSGGVPSNVIRLISGRTRTGNSPSTSGIYLGNNVKGPFGEINKNNLAQSFLGHEYSPRTLCIGSEICVPALNSSGTLCWVNHYNGVPVAPVTGITLRINANYGVTFASGGSSIQMYRIVQQAVT